jgi:hypothetical protein
MVALVLCAPGSSTAGAPTEAVELQLIANLPDQIVHVANSGVAGDDRLFLVRKVGVIQVYDGASTLTTPFLDIRDLVIGTTLSTSDERGLLSVAFDPDYATNGFFYVNYIDNGGDTVVARYQVSADANVADAGSASIVLGVDQPAANHNGGQLQFGPDGFLYVGMGDGGGGCDSAGSGCNAQKTTSLLGSMLRIDVGGDDFPADAARNYAIPASNPFVSDAAVADEIWAYGLRNPWRFSFDRATGDMYVGDVGQSGSSRREEINFQAAASGGGENYGWPIAEGTQCGPGTCALGNCPTPIPSCDSLTFPIHAYSGGCAVTGGFVYRGGSIAGLVGRYVFGDYCSGDITALDLATLEAPVVADTGFGLTSFGEDVGGEIYAAVGDDVYKLVPAGGSPTDTPTRTATATPTQTATATVLGGGTLDVDGNGNIEAATDGVYVFRALLELQLVVPTSFRALDPAIPSDAAVAAAVAALGARLDVDGNGVVEAATDGVYVFRRLLGLQLVVPAAFRELDPNIPDDATIAANVDALASDMGTAVQPANVTS